MGSLLRPADPQEHAPAPPSPQPHAKLSSKHTTQDSLPTNANINDAAIPLAAKASEGPPPKAQSQDPPRSGIPTAITRRLYLSHFLSTWNSRSFEFGAVLFLASVFPLTLLPLSIYALVRSASAIVLAPVIGRAIDRRRRLPVVRFSIVAGRAAVIVSCVGFWGLLTYTSISSSVRWGVFSAVTLLSCIEKPCSVLNLVAVERDWVVVLAENDEPGLQTLNARMRRIDLFCKLAGPLFIALINGASTTIAIFLTLGTNVLSVPIEYFAIAQVYRVVPRLKDPKNIPSITTENDAFEQTPPNSLRYCPRWISSLYQIFRFYYQHRAFLPSFALSLLYLTVLTFGGQMVTYLLSAGYNSFHIALVRTLSVIFELSATWIAPRVMKRINPARAGMWFLSWQMLWIGAATSFFWAEPTSLVAASGLVAGTILSRIGLWGYDLCAQFIIQEEVQGSQRGSFSSTEASFQNAFELLSYVTTIIWSHPSQFRYPVVLSAVAVYSAGFLFGKFLRRERGHLVHMPVCMVKRKESDVEVDENG